MHSPKELHSLYHNEMQLVRVCAEIERTGLLINPFYVQKGLEYENDQIRISKESFENIVGRPYIDSNKAFKEIFDSRGESYGKTAKGNASFTAEVLEQFDTPTARLINKIRYHEKRAGTYWSSFLYYADANNQIHPSLNAAGTTTGRFSCSNPNLQNVPKEDAESDKEKPFIVRRAFIPPPGYFIASIDYSQMEYRMVMDYAGEMDVITMLQQGWDAHEAVAKLTGLTRSLAKNVNFAILYGAGDEKLGKMIGKTKKEASEIRKLYFAKLPKLRKLIWDVTKIGENEGFIFNWMGRRSWCTKYEWSYALINSLIQGGCADVVKKAMVEIFNQKLDSCQMVLSVHDELLFYVKEGNQIVLSQIKDMMENIYLPKNGLNLPVNVSHSFKSWAHRDMIKGTP